MGSCMPSCGRPGPAAQPPFFQKFCFEKKHLFYNGFFSKLTLFGFWGVPAEPATPMELAESPPASHDLLPSFGLAGRRNEKKWKAKGTDLGKGVKMRSGGRGINVK